METYPRRKIHRQTSFSFCRHYRVVVQLPLLQRGRPFFRRQSEDYTWVKQVKGHLRRARALQPPPGHIKRLIKPHVINLPSSQLSHQVSVMAEENDNHNSSPTHGYDADARRRQKFKERSRGLPRGTSAPLLSPGTEVKVPLLLGHGQGHQFAKKTFFQPTFCHHCTELLWGLKNQGLKCPGWYYGKIDTLSLQLHSAPADKGLHVLGYTAIQCFTLMSAL